MDETGRPLYGDVFGLDQPETGPSQEEEEIDKTMWGELESEESEEEEEVRILDGISQDTRRDTSQDTRLDTRLDISGY